MKLCRSHYTYIWLLDYKKNCVLHIGLCAFTTTYSFFMRMRSIFLSALQSVLTCFFRQPVSIPSRCQNTLSRNTFLLPHFTLGSLGYGTSFVGIAIVRFDIFIYLLYVFKVRTDAQQLMPLIHNCIVQLLLFPSGCRNDEVYFS